MIWFAPGMPAIPWDECRANKNIVLVTPKHGGHVAFFEGTTGSSLWWVRAVVEYLHVLHSSKYMHVKKTKASFTHLVPESSIDQGTYVNVSDGMVAAMGSEQMRGDTIEETETRKPRGKETTNAASDDRVDSARIENSSFLQDNIARTPEQHRSSSSCDESSPGP